MKTFHAKDFSSPLTFFASEQFMKAELPIRIDIGDGTTFKITQNIFKGIYLGCAIASSWPKKEPQ